MARALRYFVMIRLHPSYAVVLLGAIVAMGIVTAALNPDELDSGLGMLLFVQVFLASAGFAVRARRGEFDALVTAAGSRSRVAAAHWLVAIGPGVAGWLVLAGVGAFIGSGSSSSALFGDRMAALFIVSAVAWAAGFHLPRGAAGVVWIAVLVALLATKVELIASAWHAWPSPVALLLHAVVLTICPFLLIGVHPPLAPGSVPAAICLALTIWVCVVRRAKRLDIYLLESA
jgi:hypothetical protein